MGQPLRLLANADFENENRPMLEVISPEEMYSGFKVQKR
jgi:hypothetical protein